MQNLITSIFLFNAYISGTVSRREILVIKDDPRTIRVNIYLMAVDP